jgi:hypothetical protein
MNRTHYSPAIDVMIDGWDGGDPWGSAMSLAFAVCDVALAAGVPEPGWLLKYSPGMSSPNLDEMADETNDSDTTLEAHLLASAYLDGSVSDADLIRAARVLRFYLLMCKRAGFDY